MDSLAISNSNGFAYPASDFFYHPPSSGYASPNLSHRTLLLTVHADISFLLVAYIHLNSLQ